MPGGEEPSGLSDPGGILQRYCFNFQTFLRDVGAKNEMSLRISSKPPAPRSSRISVTRTRSCVWRDDHHIGRRLS